MARSLRLVGAVMVLGSLWMPWYGIHLPADFGSQLGSQVPAGLAGFAQTILAAIPKSFSVTAWQAMSGGDVAMAMLAGALVLTCAASVDAQIVGALALALVVIVVVHLVSRPFPVGVTSLKPGAWVALLGALAALASAALRDGEPGVVPLAAPLTGWGPAPAADSASSVPPPR